jgi:two-component sensor histidine kinase
MPMKKQAFHLLLLQLFVVFFANAQEPFYTVIDKSKGLPSNSVYCIAQDKKGFIWVTHNEGISSFDGLNFTNYSSLQQSSKAGSYINEDKYGRIWYSNFDGYIFYIEADSLKALPMREPFGYTRYGITEDYLYVVLRNGIDVYSLKDLRKLKTIPLNAYYFSGCLSKGKRFYIQLSKLYIIEGLNIIGQHELLKPKNKKGLYIPMAATDNGILFGDRANGDLAIYEKTEQDLKRFDLPYKYFFQNYSYAGGYFWACSPTGVYGIGRDGKLLSNFGKPFFKSFNISSVFEDREGNFWFSSLSDGLLFVSDIKTSYYEMPNEKPIKLDTYGNGFYVGTRKGSIFEFANRNVPKKILPGRDHEILNLKYDPSLKQLFYTDFEFNILDKNLSRVHYRTTSVKEVAKVDNKYYAYASSGNLCLVLVNSRAGSSIWDSIFIANQDTLVAKESNLLGYAVRGKSVATMPDTHLVYFATNLGLYELSPYMLTKVKDDGQEFFASRILAYHYNLFCLNGNGQVFVMSKQKVFSKLNLPFNVKDIKIYQDKLFLIGENFLYVLSLALQKSKPMQLAYLAKGQEINDVLFHNDEIIMAINSGIVVAKPKSNLQVKRKAPFYITSWQLGGKERPLKDIENVLPKDNRVVVNYALLNYNSANDIDLYYKINEGDWILTYPGNRKLELPSLSPGYYEIQFKQGDFEPETQKLRFSINAPFYQQFWFYILVIAVTLVLLVIFYQLRVFRIKESNRLQMEKVELEKSLGQSMLTAIKSQMNPHFFYNALNTIQSYILTNDKQMASAYLNKFSRLTRMILEMSGKEMVSLDDEIKALRFYLELEQARFADDDFQYEFIIDEQLETELIQIPSMMIQPYVENAIKHGLLHKFGAKRVSVEFMRNDELLFVIVDDNGVGRRESSRINSYKKEKWNSFSTSANEKRIQILNSGREKLIGIEYVDKIDTMGQATGTRVRITIPLDA